MTTLLRPVISEPGYERPLWRAIAVFRVAVLAYAVFLVVRNVARYAVPWAGWVVAGVMAVWTAAAVYAYAHRRWRRWPVLLADLAVTTGCLVATRPVVGLANLADGMATLPVAWIAGPVLACAAARGRWAGAGAALVVGVADLSMRGGTINQSALTGTVLLLLTGIAVGHLGRLAADAEAALAQAAQLTAATRERERLARGIHDSVLQVLALVQRRGAELGGEAAVLGRLAGEQGAALRTLVSASDRTPIDTGDADLAGELARFVSPTVQVSSPASAVVLPAHVVDEVSAAVASALDNVGRHCPAGTRAYLLIEDEGATVVVTVRDDGPGFAEGRLAEARRAGRLGVALSIEGRLRDLGGTARIMSTPGDGTEVELRIPR